MDAEAWWEAVGSIVNEEQTVKRAGRKKKNVCIIPPGGRDGRYWGSLSQEEAQT